MKYDDFFDDEEEGDEGMDEEGEDIMDQGEARHTMHGLSCRSKHGLSCFHLEVECRMEQGNWVWGSWVHVRLRRVGQQSRAK
jgi:hypothetical protein